MYALHGRQLFEAADRHAAAKAITELKTKLRDRIPSFDEFSALFPEILFTDNLTKQRKLVRYILVCMDVNESMPTTVDYNQMTIEHIASQSQISRNLPENVVGQIGNLLLVSESLNQKLQNRNFTDKKKMLRDKGYKLPEEIDNATQWGAKEIKQRTQSLAKVAYERVWKI